MLVLVGTALQVEKVVVADGIDKSAQAHAA